MNRANKVNSSPRTNKVAGATPPRTGAAAPRVKHRNRPLCRTSEYMPPGSDRVGLTKDNQPSKVVWELDYGLSAKQFELLSARFPGVAFVQTGMECHDHPIAHTSYRIVWTNVLKGLQPGWKVADVAGNPTWNEQFNSTQVKRDRPIKIDTFCKVLSPKDSVREKTRWGPPVGADGAVRWEEMTVYDMYRNDENRQRFKEYDAFLMNHSLYYYTKAEINRLVNLNKNSVLYATVHKLDGQNGYINCGEQKYEKDLVTGNVVQTNVETGEVYKHPDPAPWFRDFCYADECGAMAWTINKGCDDTYKLTITSTKPTLVPEECWSGGRIVFNNGVETVEVAAPVGYEPPPAYTVEEVKFKTTDLLPTYPDSKEVVVKLTHPELYETLKKWMINKPRNSTTLRDLTAKAHREAGNNTLMGASRRIDISSKALTEHIFAAWMSGVGHEAEMFQAVTASGTYASAVNRNLAGKTLNINSSNLFSTMTKFSLRAYSVVNSKEPVHAVLAHIDELL